jgi:hypothetical protein
VEELVELSGYQRKSVLRLLEVLWEASDDLCGKRLAAVLLTLVLALERHGHLEIEPALRQKLLQLSPASFDRLHAPARWAQGEQHGRRCSRIVTGVRRLTTVRTFHG